MKKTYFIILFFIGLAEVKAFSKDSSAINSDIIYVQKNLAVANLLLPGITYERGIGQMSTISVTAGINAFILAKVDSQTGTSSNFEINPAVNLSYRHYYNFIRRIEKGKNTKYNSANYIGLSLNYIGAPFINNMPAGLNVKDNYNIGIGPVWGFQRTYRKRLHINLDLGFGYVDKRFTTTNYFSYLDGNGQFYSQDSYAINTYSGIGFLGNFRLGFYLGKM